MFVNECTLNILRLRQSDLSKINSSFAITKEKLVELGGLTVALILTESLTGEFGPLHSMQEDNSAPTNRAMGQILWKYKETVRSKRKKLFIPEVEIAYHRKGKLMGLVLLMREWQPIQWSGLSLGYLQYSIMRP